MQITLPDPCPICEGPVTYGGRGRRPAYCSTACKNVQRAEDMRNRRARERREVAPVDPLIKALAERRRQRIAAEPRIAVIRAHDEQLMTLDDIAADAASEGYETAIAAGGYVPDGWAERTATPRAADPASRWIAENYPEELADFPPACRPA